MRVPFLGLMTAGLVAAQLVAAPVAMAQCVRPADHASLDIMAPDSCSATITSNRSVR